MARTITHEGYTISPPRTRQMGTNGGFISASVKKITKAFEPANSRRKSCVQASRKLISMGLPLANASSMGR